MALSCSNNAGSATAVLNHTFSTKPEALSAAVAVLEQLDVAVAWREQRYADLGQLDPGGLRVGDGCLVWGVGDGLGAASDDVVISMIL